MQLSNEEIRILSKVCEGYARDLLDPYERALEPALEDTDLTSEEIKGFQRIRLRLGTSKATRDRLRAV